VCTKHVRLHCTGLCSIDFWKVATCWAAAKRMQTGAQAEPDGRVALKELVQAAVF